MKGIQYLVDDKGEKRAVVLDLKVHRALWEDIQDILVARERLKGPTVPMEEVVARLKTNGKVK